jgi:DNA-binding IclR family transcriptional regulator
MRVEPDALAGGRGRVKCLDMVSDMRKASRYPLTSVDSALRLIVELQHREQLKLTEAAGFLGVANSTAHRLLAALVARGFAVQDRDRSYRRGPAIVMPSVEGLADRRREIIHEALIEMVAELDETCHYVVLEGNGVRFVDGVTGTRVPRVGLRTGQLLPAHSNSGGRAMLAALAPRRLRALYPRGPHGSRGGSARADLASLERVLATTRHRGYGVNADESAPGVFGIGRRIHAPGSVEISAIEVGVPATRFQARARAALASVLIEHADALEQRLRRAEAGTGPTVRVNGSVPPSARR